VLPANNVVDIVDTTTFLISLLLKSATYKLPDPSEVIAYGPLKRAALPDAFVVPLEPVELPASNATDADDTTIRRISLLPASATYILPEPSSVIHRGVLNLAELPVAFVLPELPDVFPAHVLTVA
jgi:hypothetical protein